MYVNNETAILKKRTTVPTKTENSSTGAGGEAIARILPICFLILVTLNAFTQSKTLALPDTTLIQQIAKWLPKSPKGFGEPYQNRGAWMHIADKATATSVIKRAEALLTTTFPRWSDSAYMDYFETGSREKSGKMFTDRGKWLPALVWAECFENKGRFISAIEMVINEYAKQTSWVLPPHDVEKQNILKVRYSVDLVAADIAQTIAQADFLLNNKLSAATRQLIQKQLQQRIFEPVLSSLKNNYKRGHGWLLDTNNWNSVCLSGVTGAALAALPNKEDRARFVAIAKIYSQNYMDGFTADGYCTEGLGYYDYGFSRYIFLRENILQSTNGKLDLFEGEKIRKIAAYPLNIQMADGVYPTIADCKVGVKPLAFVLWYNDKVLGLGLQQYDTMKLTPQFGSLVEDAMLNFPNSAWLASSKTTLIKQNGALRSWFDEAGILVARPSGNPANQLSVCIKGGNNNEHHNHNDLGSYTLALGNKKIIEDPGGPYVYTSTTFSKERYTITCINSYGHPVPLIAGQQQETGITAKAEILNTKFSDDKDELNMDLTTAYKVPGIKKMQRGFVYDRKAKGSLTVTDVFEADSVSNFETALITRTTYKIITPSTIEFETDNGYVVATINANGQAFEIKKETITEEKPAFDRIAIRLATPTKKAIIEITYTPK